MSVRVVGRQPVAVAPVPTALITVGIEHLQPAQAQAEMREVATVLDVIDVEPGTVMLVASAQFASSIVRIQGVVTKALPFRSRTGDEFTAPPVGQARAGQRAPDL